MSARHLHTSISEELGSFIKSKSSTFACGGEIPLQADSNASPSTLALRWDSSNSNPLTINKLNFPTCTSLMDEVQTTNFIKLVQDCQPATFGYQGSDVLDETYRKAGKLDRSAFSIDFCPYEHGIIDTIAQVLLPNAGGTIGTRGVKAELYKLNVYSAPSGFFKPHVDTPRSSVQFGSLVVSLPCSHSGGQLVVRHAEHSVTFDYSMNDQDPAAVKWAAFYSDCEHEVLEVTSGHRITLTYNLYYTPGIGDLAGNKFTVMDVKSLPLYEKVREAFASSDFMGGGGYLGIYCTHAYAHTTTSGINSLPGILKGSDMAVFSVLTAFGLNVVVRPILQIDDRDDYTSNTYENYNSETEEYEYDYDPDERFVGQLRPTLVTEEGAYHEHQKAEVLKAFGGTWAKVEWLTEPLGEAGLGLAHLTYGNEAGVAAVYTHAAMLVSIPPFAERVEKMGLSGKLV